MHKEQIEQSFKSIIAEKLAEKPNELRQCSIQENAIDGFKTLCEENNIGVNFAVTSNGEFKAIYEQKDCDAIDKIREEYKQINADVRENVTINVNSKGAYFITDTATNKTLTLPEIRPQATLERHFREQLGFSPEKARQTAEKLKIFVPEKDIAVFNTDRKQAELIDKVEKNITFQADNIRIKEFEITRIKFQKDKVNRFLIETPDGKSIAVIPSKTSKKELETAIKDGLGIENPDTVKLLAEKTEKIEKEIRNQEKFLAEQKLAQQKIIEKQKEQAKKTEPLGKAVGAVAGAAMTAEMMQQFQQFQEFQKFKQMSDGANKAPDKSQQKAENLSKPKPPNTSVPTTPKKPKL